MFKESILYFTMAALEGLSFNVHCIKSQLRRITVFNFLAAFNVSVFFLQECAVPHMSNYETFAKDWTHGPSVWSGSNGNKNAGVAILFKGPAKIHHIQELVPGRVLFVSVSIDGIKWDLLNVYAPPDTKDRIELFETLNLFMANIKPTLVAGDFNCTLNVTDRYGPGVKMTDRSANLLKSMITDFKFKDIFMTLNKNIPLTDRVTWQGKDAGSRIDYIFAAKCLLPLSCVHKENVISDHKVVIFKVLSPAEQKVGRGFWKLNTSLLQDDKVYKDFSKLFKEWQTEKLHATDILTWWDIVKGRIKRFFIKLGVQKAKEKREFFDNLNTQLQTLYKLKGIGCDVDDNISTAKENIKKCLEEKAKEVIFKSRVKHVEENEKCTKYFFRKIQMSKEIITEIEGEHSRGGIMRKICSFYQSLYDTKNIDTDFLNDTLKDITMVLNQEDAESLNEILTEDELLKTIQSFQKSKVPGLDGLPIEFYLQFWDFLKNDLLNVLSKCFLYKKLPHSWRRGVITLLPKEGDKTQLKNWRPITLLNLDYKIFAKILANRLKRVIDKVIHSNQVCGIPGRRIHHITNLIRDSIWYTKERKQSLAILSLDFEKAFDHISHVYLFNVLHKMGIPEGFLSSLKSLYNKCTSQVLVNGFMTEGFTLKCGVKQGCPLSPLLFVCAVEPLLCSIRKDKVIRGVHLPGSGGLQVKITGYMDDLAMLCTNTTSVHRAIKRTEYFCAASGFKLNLNKSSMMEIGNWEPSLDCPIQKKESLKILGTIFTSKNDGEESWNVVMQRINRKVIGWKMRQLTFEGKILLLKMVLLPILLYTALTFPPTVLHLTQVVRTCFLFVWGSKMERLKRIYMMKSPEKGGKGMPNIKRFLYTKYLVLCLQAHNTEAIWSFFLRYATGFTFRKHGWYNLSLKSPFCLNPPWFYSILQTIISDFNLHNKTREDLCDKLKLKLHFNAAETLIPIIQMPEDEVKIIWANVSHKQLHNSQKDLAWACVHECLPTKVFQHKRGVIPSAKCPRSSCRSNETVKHILWDCFYAKELWRKVKPLLEQVAGIKVLNFELVLYGKVETIPQAKFVILWKMINSFKEALWKVRNKIIFNSNEVTVNECISLSFSAMRLYVLLDEKNSTNKSKLWCQDKWFTCTS